MFPLTRLFLTAFIIALAMGLNFVWESLEAPVTGEAAVKQLEDSMVGFAVAKRMTQHIPQQAFTYGATVLVLLIWVPWVIRRLNTFVASPERPASFEEIQARSRDPDREDPNPEQENPSPI